MNTHHIARVPRGCFTVRRASPVTCIAVQRMCKSPAHQVNTKQLDVSRSTAAPVIASRFKVADVRDERWTRPTSVVAVRGRAGEVFMAPILPTETGHGYSNKRSELL